VVLANIYLFKAALQDQNLFRKVQAWNKSLRDLAYTRQIVYADVFSKMNENGGEKLLDDLLHPNTEGHRIISESVLDALNQ
jgi:lysophospholipase L1-like esterase